MGADKSHLSGEAGHQHPVVDYIAKVRRIAYGMARTLPRSVSVDDLIGAGLVGLADALAKGDASNETAFECYMGRRVRGAMIDELRRADPLTRPRRRFERKKERVVQDLTGRLGRTPDEAEVAERMGVPTALLREHLLHARFQGFSAFDAVSGSGEGDRQFPDSSSELADVRMVHTERRDRLVAAIDTLPERLQTVVAMYYEQDDSLRQIGARLGVSESRVCQLHRQAIEMLRAACPNSEGPESDEANHLAPALGWS
jgi:RNA polymerase sigma factor FliA